MSTIRRQSILSSGIIYFGFALGFLNTYLFTRQGGFTQAEYGLTGAFIAIANIINSFANLGMQAYIYKFYPYYKDNLEPQDSDMMTWSLLTSLTGFVLVLLAGFIFKDLVIRKFGAHSEELVRYYYWIFPFGFGLTIYSLLEAFAWQLKRSVQTTLMREVIFRIFATLLIVLFLTGVLSGFDAFIKWFALTYIFLALILLLLLVIKKEIHLSFRISRVTRKFRKKILLLCSFIWSGSLVVNISNVFDSIVIAAVMPNGLAYVGIFTLGQNIASLIQAPQRGIIAASIAPLSRAWKEKDFEKINKIYHRSSINQLIFACGIFVLIWLNFSDGVLQFRLQPAYLKAQYVFLFLGLMRIVDMGTGVNAQIIGTSTYWRFDFFTGIILLSISLPLNYILTKKMGVIGPAIATFIALAVYNSIRYTFLLRKFRMQPFTIRTLFTLLLAFTAYLIPHLLFGELHGLTGILGRTLVFMAVYMAGIVFLKLTPDLVPVWNTLRKKFGRSPGG
jgi:O-antigen/teichoic acid export membrane protein